MKPLLYLAMFVPFANAAAPLKIADWNIHRGRHLENVVAALRAQTPDIVLLQEVDLEVRQTGGLDIAAEIAKRLGMHYVFAPAFQEVGQAANEERPGMQGQAVLSRAPIAGSRVLHFERQTAFWKPRPYLPDWALMQRRLGGRIALVAEIQTSGHKTVVYDVHLESRGFGYSRGLQLEETLADARTYPKTVPIIIGGDFNSIYGPTELRERMEREGFKSCFGGQKVRTHIIWGYLDWIFVRGPIECSDAEVIRKTQASDHDMLTAKVRPSQSNKAIRAGSR